MNSISQNKRFKAIINKISATDGYRLMTVSRSQLCLWALTMILGTLTDHYQLKMYTNASVVPNDSSLDTFHIYLEQ